MRQQAFKQLAPLAAALAAAPARAVDLDAGDYTALPADTNALVVYGQHATRDKLYSKGNKVLSNPGLDSDVGILRGVHFMDIGGYIVDPQFLLPFGRLKGKDDTSALGSKSSIGDLILASAIWFTKPGVKTHFAIAESNRRSHLDQVIAPRPAG
ncbi:transporter [Variovorax sp. RT4R15]|uniref:transporter n=1 Tax=Variovorax sp. RT4R15 TaxID=3443737 RepID=UPI003F454ABD